MVFKRVIGVLSLLVLFSLAVAGGEASLAAVPISSGEAVSPPRAGDLPECGIFPDGNYITNLYRGGFLSKTVIWTVGGQRGAREGAVAVGSIVSAHMSSQPGGDPENMFPSGTRKVYLILEYENMEEETVVIRVFGNRQQPYFEDELELSGSGTDPVEVCAPLDKILLPLTLYNHSGAVSSMAP